MRVRAIKTTVDNMTFDSKHEAAIYGVYKALQQRGQISKLQCHPTFTFIVQGLPIAKYTPDFSYHDEKDRLHIIDAKGFRKSKKTGKLLPRVDREFHIKKKLMQACFGLEVEIV